MAAKAVSVMVAAEAREAARAEAWVRAKKPMALLAEVPGAAMAVAAPLVVVAQAAART